MVTNGDPRAVRRAACGAPDAGDDRHDRQDAKDFHPPRSARVGARVSYGHIRAVRDAILDTTWALAAKQGLTSVTMMQVAEKAGIGRATLYKYFPDIEAILVAWHRRHVADHLEHLAKLRDQADEPSERLKAVLEAYALISYHRGRHSAELVALLHRGDQVARAEHRLRDLVRDLLIEVAGTGRLRDDAAPDELAAYRLHSLTAASSLSSEAAVKRLVKVTLTGLRANAIAI